MLRAVAPLRIDVETNRELRDLVVTIFDRTFAITYALDVIAITIAVLGVVSTLFALVLERRREFGLLRYLGVTTRGIRASVLTEAAGIGLLGGGLGVGVGMLLALLLIFVINRQAFGWLIELHVPWGFLGQTILLVVVAAVVAGFIRRGWRLGFGRRRRCGRNDFALLLAIGAAVRRALRSRGRSARASVRALSLHSGELSPSWLRSPS